MKHSQDYYAQIFALLTTGRLSYIRTEELVRLLYHTDAVAMVDRFAEEFQHHLNHVAEDQGNGPDAQANDTDHPSLEENAQKQKPLSYDNDGAGEAPDPEALEASASVQSETQPPEVAACAETETPEPDGHKQADGSLSDDNRDVATEDVTRRQEAGVSAEPDTQPPEATDDVEPAAEVPMPLADMPAPASPEPLELPDLLVGTATSPKDGAGPAPLAPGDVPSVSTATKEPAVNDFRCNIPNGRSGEPYECELGDLASTPAPEGAYFVLESAGGNDLSIEGDRLIGTLGPAGNTEVRVNGHTQDGRLTVRFTLKLAVIPNPRDLWKDLPSDPDAPYAKADCDVDRVVAGNGWRMQMASQRGRSHAHKGLQRDDHGLIRATATGWHILIVADGAGSCGLSREGSRLICTHAGDHLQAYLEADDCPLESAATEFIEHGDGTMRQSLNQALHSSVLTGLHAGYQAIAAAARESGVPAKAFSTTTLLALHKHTERGSLVITFGIGDGGIAALTRGRGGKLLNDVDGGAHAGQTRFLDAKVFSAPDEDFYPRIKIHRFAALDALVLATDGVTDPLFDSDNDLKNARQWWEMFDTLAPVLGDPARPEVVAEDPLVQYLDFFKPGHHDDRTLAVLMVPDPTTTEQAPEPSPEVAERPAEPSVTEETTEADELNEESEAPVEKAERESAESGDPQRKESDQ